MTAEIEICDANFDILEFIFKKYGAKVRLFCKLCNFYFKKISSRRKFSLSNA